ncbi:hypothetical protein [Actinomadura rubrisoli]|uniref:WD40 repeat domain-containing protein n=1 Tax=Actinomadura rubrisoli TaxID=2530368 RepID=A0A4R4ZW93_9ACTN|nr:hypothetical protein [Actinomadura rubrisoli]TDD63528.1 hypothetical protein E1298_43790 [Actinomadura rubrisoli]
MVDELSEDARPPAGEAPAFRWWVRRWAAPIGLAVAVAASVAGVRLVVDESAPPAAQDAEPGADYRRPRFTLVAGRNGAPTKQGENAPWFQIYANERLNQRPFASVQPPEPSAGEVSGILEGPGGTFVVASARAEPCVSGLYRFRLTGDGHVTGMTPVKGGAGPGLVGGMALSPDGRRIAFATAPCATERHPPPGGGMPPRAAVPPRAALTVLDTATGNRRTWTTGGPSLIGEIVWARDGRTLGYTISEVHPASPAPSGSPAPSASPASPSSFASPTPLPLLTPPASPTQVPSQLPSPMSPQPPDGGSSRDTVGTVTVHALDTGAPGTELRAGRVLFRSPDGSGKVSSAVMDPDGRTGFGLMYKGEPADTILFSFAEGQAMRVTSVIKAKPDTATAVALGGDDEPRHACLGGIDAFGRVVQGSFEENSQGAGGCHVAWAD